MQFDKVKQKCLKAFAARYPGDNRVIVVKRSDSNVKVLNKDADCMLFDRKGNEVVTEQYLEGLRNTQVMVIEATFEEIE